MRSTNLFTRSCTAVLAPAAAIASLLLSLTVWAAPAVSLSAVSFPTTHDGWVAAHAGSKGLIFTTHDGGRSWVRFPAAFEATDLQFVDARHGWVDGLTPASCDSSGGPECRSVLESTADGGRTWTGTRLGPGS